MLSNNHIIIRPGMKGELTFNPINPIRIEDRDEHIAVITDIFSDTYGFTHPQSYLFKLSLEATLENYDMTGEKEPNLTALIKMIEKYPLKSYYDLETKAALMRRLTPLIKGQARNAFIGDKRISMEKILSTNVVIELGHLRETKTREIYSQLLLKQLYDYRLMSGPSIFNHITVVEEARYIVPTRRSYDPPSTMERMIGELRKFGESIFIVSQFPSQISHEVVKNAAIHIYHRIIGMEDLKIIANSAPLSQSQIEHLKKLDTGEAIIKDFRYRDPVLIKVVPRIK
jgi:DNA helicase HerA-like ATPase